VVEEEEVVVVCVDERSCSPNRELLLNRTRAELEND
jgi:hypothetical protein